MPKRLRSEPIYIAPEIIGKINESGHPWVFDERTNEELNPWDPFDKIKIYERQVNGWFLEPARNLIRYNNDNKGFIVLMVCLSYIEGVEEYKTGESSRNQSNIFFRNCLHRIYPDQFQDHQLDILYIEARCGLFHNGMVRGQVVINNSFDRSISFHEDTIKISPSKFLKDIIGDFDAYIETLRTDENARGLFNRSYSNL